MKHAEIIDLNRVIAVFMGARLIKSVDHEMPHGSQATITIEHWASPHNLPGYSKEAEMGHFRYDRDWHWIVPVLDKIASMGNTYAVGRNEHGPFCSIRLGDFDEISCFGSTPIEAAWNAVIDFVDIYNNKKP